MMPSHVPPRTVLTVPADLSKRYQLVKVVGMDKGVMARLHRTVRWPFLWQYLHWTMAMRLVSDAPSSSACISRLNSLFARNVMDLRGTECLSPVLRGTICQIRGLFSVVTGMVHAL